MHSGSGGGGGYHGHQGGHGGGGHHHHSGGGGGPMPTHSSSASRHHQPPYQVAPLGLPPRFDARDTHHQSRYEHQREPSSHGAPSHNPGYPPGIQPRFEHHGSGSHQGSSQAPQPRFDHSRDTSSHGAGTHPGSNQGIHPHHSSSTGGGGGGHYQQQPPPQQHQQQQHQQPQRHHQPPQPSHHHSAHPNGNKSAALPPAPTPTQYRQPTEEEQAEMDRQKVTPALLKYIEEFKFPYINDVNCYEKLLKIGQGTFGEVFKARCRTTNRMVALKKILMENEKEGFPITALREVKMLQQLKHQHITELIEICSNISATNQKDRATFYLVFTFCEHDLAGLLSNSGLRMTLTHCKTLMKHLLSGLHQIHHSGILHRDMKAANVLITKDGILKLADFGLARPYFKKDNKHLYTNRVVTLWYRPPELLLGERQYGPQIDIWGAGCIMAELWTRSPILQGDTEQKQLQLISQLCGSICPEVWRGVENLPLYRQMELPQNLNRLVSSRLGSVIKDQNAVQLIDRLLSLDPSKRGSAEEALDHTFFFAAPEPREDVRDLMATISQSLFEYTSGRGAHANRRRPQAGPGGGAGGVRAPNPPRQNVSSSGQFHDMVF